VPLTVGQGLLQGVTFGAGTAMHFAPEYVSGIGVPVPKDEDVDLEHGDGGYAGTDRKGIRSIIIPFRIVGPSAASCMASFDTLAAAWEPVDADVELELFLPGKHFTVQGRPRGLPDDLSRLRNGVISTIGLFVCLDPTMTAVV
jgi:hypothetical protein